MKTLLKVLGWIFVFIAVVGSPQVIIRNNFHWTTFLAMGVYVALAWLCFLGSGRIKNQNAQKNNNQL